MSKSAIYASEPNAQKEKGQQTSTLLTYLDDSPHYDTKQLTLAEQKELLNDSASTFSSSTLTPSTTFHATRKLLINARGIGAVRLPVPPSEMQISISTEEGELVYVSTREKRCKGNATLANADGKELIKSEYLWGPGRDPKLRVFKGADWEEIGVKGKWTSRMQEFTDAGGKTLFAWRYVRELDLASGKKNTFLVMETSPPNIAPEIGSKSKDKYHNGIRRVAQLVRNDVARTPGTKSCDAGNGGELVIDGVVLEGMGLGEDIVVASCLMMLKKEIDRRMMVQAVAIAGAGS
jgi:hypothetical protein